MKRLPDFAGKAVDIDSLETSATLSRYGKKTVGMASPTPKTPEQEKEAAELKVRLLEYRVFHSEIRVSKGLFHHQMLTKNIT